MNIRDEQWERTSVTPPDGDLTEVGYWADRGTTEVLYTSKDGALYRKRSWSGDRFIMRGEVWFHFIGG